MAGQAILTSSSGPHGGTVARQQRHRPDSQQRGLGSRSVQISSPSAKLKTSVSGTDQTKSKSWCDRIQDLLITYENIANTDRGPHVWSEILSIVKGEDTDAEADVAHWMENKCDARLWRRFTQLAPFPSCDNDASRLSVSYAPASPVHAGYNWCTKQCHAANRMPHIAILLGSTSRGVSDPSTSNLALFTLSLPSIAKTVECGFCYSIFLGYDVEDPFYDSHAGSDALLVWFQNEVRRPLEERGILVDLVPVRIPNPEGKPGPAFNAVAERAHAAGADFFYRSNDDTLLLTPWASAFVCALCSLGYPFGVVGPVENHRPDILTCDFVHKTHFDIFDDYYPTQLNTWWMDDWISKVYGSSRSLRLASVKVNK